MMKGQPLSVCSIAAIFALIFTACGSRPSNSDHAATPDPCPEPLLLPTNIPYPTVIPTPLNYTEEEAYLGEALQHIRKVSIRQERIIDWWPLHDYILAYADGPHSIPETYAAIRYALEQLCDNHSFFVEPAGADRLIQGIDEGVGLTIIYPEKVVIEVLPDSPAERAGVRVGDVVLLVNGREPTTVENWPYVDLGEGAEITLTLLQKGPEELVEISLQAGQFGPNPLPSGRRLAADIGYVEITRFLGEDEAANGYAAELQQIIREVDRVPTCGWVVDLRRNSGGNLWPMLAGAAPIIGDGWVGSLFEKEGKVIPWVLRPNRMELGGQTIVTVEGDGYRLQQSEPAVVVLTSRITASAGEGVLVAFLSHDKTYLIGEPTAGKASANRAKVLSDGAILFVTSAYFADVNKQIFQGAIVPDLNIEVDWSQLGTDGDLLLQEAIAWLESQPACMK